MTDSTWKRAKQIFNEALERSGSERSDHIASACGDDRELREQVEDLLNAHEEAGEFLASPTLPESEGAAASTMTELAATEKAGATIGPYKLLQVIGEGGFGVVYMAEQEEPVRRRVALKIIKLGMDTRQVIARFEAERQALALMEHPNIARVLDAGATETGRPYFVMELVKGIPITEYCDSNRLSAPERLELFREVCSAVQHAHQKGIIHRDIKPSNVLVTLHDGKPVPKVIDFGIAKATHQRLTEKTLFTEYGQFIGTPVYMSPEQAEMSGLDIDTRSDIYSLGVLLYELLTGVTPFDMETLRRAGYAEMQRMIREQEPPKPSIRVSTLGGALNAVAEHRRIDPGGLSRLLRGELDWIVMKALEKERARRYGSANELADDLAKYVRNEPVMAGPPSAAYRAAKFMRRHRVGVTIAMVALLSLIGFATRERIQAKRIAREHDRASREAEALLQVSKFQAAMLADLDPAQMGGALITDLRERVAEAQRQRGAGQDEIAAKLAAFDDVMSGVNSTNVALRVVDVDILDRAAGSLDEQFGDRPLINARLRQSIGSTYYRLGLYDQAGMHLQKALKIRKDILGDENTETLSVLNYLAWVRMEQGRTDEAEALYLAGLDTARRLLGGDDPQTVGLLSNLAGLYQYTGRYEEAEPLLRSSLEAYRRRNGEEHTTTLAAMSNLGGLYLYMNRYDEAEQLLKPTVEIASRVLGENHPDTLMYLGNLANLRTFQGRYDEAEAMTQEVLDAQRRVLGDEHPNVAYSLYNLAAISARRSERRQALERLRQAADSGFRRVEHMLQDPAFADLREDPEFQAIASEIKARNQEEQSPP